ncbi:MAG TPA: DMT family transporter [Nevskiaceae bacterium]|nr:DMT family transporter [Nevskiaceae bacterium]
MPLARVAVLTALAMVAFAGNSLLCRLALAAGHIDAASFTSVRLASGAVTLAALVLARKPARRLEGSWPSALALFAYAIAFSFAYTGLSAATGALLLFGAVQGTMVGVGFARGERLTTVQAVGMLVAVGGLVGLLLPGLTAPPLVDALLMLGAGVAWGVYSLRGRRAQDATAETAGNFVRSVPLALAVSAITLSHAAVDLTGVGLAVASGALTSGLGYAIWYTALPALNATTAATVQLSVPALAAAGGVVLLGEPFGVRLALASAMILGGVAVVILAKR